jgi:two-component system, response regulator, stage 0 sporulation protein F
MRVVVGEDDAEMRRLVVQALRRDGYDVGEAGDGTTLLALLHDRAARGEHIDLVISDIRMPGCTGLQVLERLRSANDRVPVILMTAFGDEDTRIEAERRGAVLFDKPFLLDDLRRAVGHLLT